MAGLLVAQDDSKKDVVDAEFTEADCLPTIGAEFTEPSDPPPPKRRWPFVLGALVLLAGYLVFYKHEYRTADFEKWPAGWADLLDCSYAVSFDGTKELNFFDAHEVTLYDKANRQPNGKFSKIDGTWAFDETTKRYTVSLNGQSSTYSLIDPDGISACMLVKGSLDAADLRGSWFARTPQDEDASNEPSEMEAKAR
jgi:hypothetical protein